VKYLCLVYQEESKLSALSQSDFDAMVGAALAYRDDLRHSGHLVAASPYPASDSATTLRVWNGAVSITDGPASKTGEQLHGFYVIDACDLNDAIRVAARMPSAKLGCVEVRPLTDFSSR
jgi:hypothetical protein